MLKDNQLSTVLLLVALGFLIYYLTKPKTILNDQENDQEYNNESFADLQTALSDIKTDTKSKSDSNTVSTLTQQPVNKQQIVNKQLNVNADISPDIIKQILDDSEPKQKIIKEITKETSTELSQDKKPIFDFEPNEYNNELGATLDSAFLRPIPQKSDTSEVSINKNNVKKYDAKDFLPKELNDKWFDTDFSQAKYNVNDDKLINTDRYVIGINTVGQSLKNASYDMRGTVANPKFTVSPWNNSTYEPDFNIKPLC